MKEKYAYYLEPLVAIKFNFVASELGYTVRVSGGMEKTYEINCSEKDFNVILSLT